MKLIAGNDLFDEEVAPAIPCAKKMLPTMFSKLLGNGDVGTMLEDGTYEPNESIRDRSIIPEVEKLVSGHSLEQDPVAIRVMRITLKPGSPKSITIEKDASEKVAAVADFITRE